ncbi:MAG: hypothetical protein KatS3mg057_3221 [Herpetosiphonaceae bacterium]|nr:MAG: hypothetical protein KatS3mg057_3221 [Herpetosiphonaceae bacterium]
MRLAVSELQQEYPGQFELVRLDFDKTEDRQAAETYGALFHPAFIFIDRRGTIHARIIGGTTKARLAQRLQEIIAEP